VYLYIGIGVLIEVEISELVYLYIGIGVLIEVETIVHKAYRGRKNI
jgi:hypothetical protein